MSSRSTPRPTMAAWWQTASTPSSARSTTLGVADVVAVGEIEHPDVVPVLAQRVDDVRADEAGATGDEDHGRTVGALGARDARRARTVQEAVMASPRQNGKHRGRARRHPPRPRRGRRDPVGPRAHAARLRPDRGRQRVDGRLGRHRPAPRRAGGRGARARVRRGLLRRSGGVPCGPRLLHGLRRIAGSGRPVARARARRRRDGRPRPRGPPGRALSRTRGSPTRS